jgi:hypothetical protein
MSDDEGGRKFNMRSPSFLATSITAISAAICIAAMIFGHGNRSVKGISLKFVCLIAQFLLLFGAYNTYDGTEDERKVSPLGIFITIIIILVYGFYSAKQFGGGCLETHVGTGLQELTHDLIYDRECPPEPDTDDIKSLSSASSHSTVATHPAATHPAITRPPQHPAITRPPQHPAINPSTLPSIHTVAPTPIINTPTSHPIAPATSTSTVSSSIPAHDQYPSAPPISVPTTSGHDVPMSPATVSTSHITPSVSTTVDNPHTKEGFMVEGFEPVSYYQNYRAY